MEMDELPLIEPGWVAFDDASPLLTDPRRRERITSEPQPRGDADERFPDVDWLRTELLGEGHVPESYQWTSQPKQAQDEQEGEWP